MMTRFTLISDAHLDMHRDRGRCWIKNLVPITDTLVIAGDLAESPQIEGCLQQICDKYQSVVYVRGNHDYWHTSIKAAEQHNALLASKISNLHILNNNAVTIEGQRFIGTTLWQKYSSLDVVFRSQYMDYRQIQDYARDIQSVSDKAERYLNLNVQAGDVVVTHHAPSSQCINPRFRGDNLNRFYYHEMTHLMGTPKAPAVWCFGHMHAGFDRDFNGTRVVSNPIGYPGEGYDRDPLVIDLVPPPSLRDPPE